MTLTGIVDARKTALVLLVLAFATGLFWGNQRHAQADEPSLAEQIICYTDLLLGDDVPFDPEVDYCAQIDEEEEEEEGDDNPPVSSYECSDGIDNDEDGFTDWGVPEDETRDPGCSTPTDDDEGDEAPPPPQETQCDDGLDNDGDGWWDLEDPGCTDASDDSEDSDVPPPPPQETQCDDGLDNDGDGWWDMEDPGCTDLSDNDETDTPDSGGGGSDDSEEFEGPENASGGGSSRRSPSGSVLGVAVEDCSKYLTAYLKIGGNNDTDQVMRLQSFLKDFEQMNVEVNGVYDEATLAAVHAFQVKYADDVLTPWGIQNSTGYVFYTTQKKVNELYCKGTNQFPLTSEQERYIAEYRAGHTVSQSSVGSQVNLTEPQPAAPALHDEEADEQWEESEDTATSTRRGFLGGIGDFFSNVLRLGR